MLKINGNHTVKKCLYALLVVATLSQGAVNPDELLPAEEAFVPQVHVSDKGIDVQFNIAEGYYLYQNKITADSTEVTFTPPKLSEGEQKEDEFFGKQVVYHQKANVKWDYSQVAPAQYRLNLHYQGCAEAGVCYPPVETSFDIMGSGLYQVAHDNQDSKSLFVKKPMGEASNAHNAQNVPPLSNHVNRLDLANNTLWLNIFWFFVAGIAMSFTACMYPLLPIVSSIIVGDKSGSKKRAFGLSLVYVQGLALTYTLVGVLAGLTGALLTVWLQQAWVILTASALMVVLALSMFGWFNIQLPASVQAYFQNQSSRLSGGKMASVFGMGMLSALIVGPCVAPPLAAAIAHIGKTGNAWIGGTALYAMAMGTGLPLIMVGTFGGHILPRAGNWMNGIKHAFGVVLLGVALYLAKGFLPYSIAVIGFALLLILPALYLITRIFRQTGKIRYVSGLLSAVLLLSGMVFSVQSIKGQTTAMHHFLTLYPDSQFTHGQKFTHVQEMQQAIDRAFAQNPNQPVLLDFYADWCVSCKEMEAQTFSNEHVQKAVPIARLIQIDVTANTPEHQTLLKQYGLFGPPGLFVLRADNTHSEALLGFVPADEFIAWYQQHQ